MPSTPKTFFRSRHLRFLASVVALPLVISGLLAGVTHAADDDAGQLIELVSTPTVSPDGKHIAFAWAGDVWIAGIDGQNLVRVTSHPADESSPKFSPSAQELAFTSDRTGDDQVYLVDLDLEQAFVGPPRQVTFHTEGYTLHGWFPDGNHVMTTGSRDHGWKYASRMIRVDVRKRTAEDVLVDAIAAEPTVHPDGNRVLLVREGERWWRKGYTGERAAQIWLYEIDSGKFTELLHEGVDCRSPVWDGDREAFFFTKGDYRGASLCRFDLESGDYQEVTNFDDDSIVFPASDADGSTLVFRHLFDLYSIDVGDKRPIDKAKRRKTGIRYTGDELTLDDEIRRRLDDADDIAFTDDGLEMLFTAGGDLWAMDTKLKEPVRLSDTPGFESSPVLVGDSAMVVSVREGQTDIWKITRNDDDQYWWQSGDVTWTRVTDDPAVESDLRISPDGKHFFFVRQPGDLYRMTIEGKDVTRVVDGFADPDFDVSSCGTWVAYSTSDNDFNQDVWITRADGSWSGDQDDQEDAVQGDGRPYNVSKHPDDDQRPRFSPDGKVLAFTGRRVDDETDVYYVVLQAEASQETARQRLLDEAIEAIAKKRKSDKKSDDKKDSDEKDGGEKDTDEKDADDKDTEDKDKKDAEEDESESEPIVIDFDGLDDRLKRISIGDSYESNLIWSPNSEKLLFNATIDGDSAIYSVTFPDELRPKKFTDGSISEPRWTKSAGGILGIISGNPAKITDAGKTETYAFTAKQTLSRSARFGEAFDEAWRTMRDRWYDAKTGGRNWNAVRRKYEDAAERAITSSAFGEIMQLMLGELNGSHNGFYASRDEPRPPRPDFTDTTAHLGARFDLSFAGPGLKVADVLPDSPADRVDSKLNPGDVITMVDGTAVDSKMDLTLVLNGPLDRDIELTVLRADRKDDDEPAVINLRPTTFGAARSQLYDKWLADNRKAVDQQSDGRLGYLHIRSMDMRSFYDFEKQLYRVGYGRDGIVIDVRDNGGGSTTDLLLTALTQPRHAITVPRDGGPGYPQSRMVYAVWQKPIVVLCNQNSFSNAEIFSHSIRNLGRGKLVGVQTAGGVISTGSVRIMDVGTMRMPFRGWFTAVDGQDMERNGAMPHHVLWPKPGDIPAGKDRQLEKAVKVLMKDVKQDAKKNPMPKLQYDTQRE